MEIVSTSNFLELPRKIEKEQFVIFKMTELLINTVKITCRQKREIKTDQEWVERKKMFCFENALSFAKIWLEEKKVDKVFIVQKQQNWWKARRGWTSRSAMTHKYKISKENNGKYINVQLFLKFRSTLSLIIRIIKGKKQTWTELIWKACYRSNYKPL